MAKFGPDLSRDPLIHNNRDLYSYTNDSACQELGAEVGAISRVLAFLKRKNGVARQELSELQTDLIRASAAKGLTLNRFGRVPSTSITRTRQDCRWSEEASAAWRHTRLSEDVAAVCYCRGFTTVDFTRQFILAHHWPTAVIPREPSFIKRSSDDDRYTTKNRKHSRKFCAVKKPCRQ